MQVQYIYTFCFGQDVKLNVWPQMYRHLPCNFKQLSISKILLNPNYINGVFCYSVESFQLMHYSIFYRAVVSSFTNRSMGFFCQTLFIIWQLVKTKWKTFHYFVLLLSCDTNVSFTLLKYIHIHCFITECCRNGEGNLETIVKYIFCNLLKL